jgi:glycerol-3-phosphate acyltransferase PlsY
VTIIFPVIAILIGYLFGSIPMGYLVARLYGIDVTKVGSGRIGGTNVLRAAGPLAAGLTVLGDILKGLLPVYFVAFFGQPWVTALAASATVLGHNYSVFLSFKGGVGAGTALGAVAGLSLPVALVAGACGLVALAISRYASILSTTIAVMSLLSLIVAAWLGYVPYQYILTGVLNLLLMFNALRPNFARLRAGTERRIGQKTQ